MDRYRNFSQRLLLVLLFGGFFTTAIDSRTPAYARDRQERMEDEVRQFHKFLNSHPKVATELRKDPELAENKRYLKKHPELASFLKHHPAIKRELKLHPRRAFGRYYLDDRKHSGRW